MKRRRVSIKDIALAAGVSHPTVSRALRNQGRMSEATRTRIVALAEEMGYTPSLVARGLVTRRSHTVGFVVANFADPFHGSVAEGIEEEAARHGYDMFIASTAVDPERELQTVRSFQGRQVDAILISSSRVGSRYAELLSEMDIPIVLINNHADGEALHAVNHDDYGGSRALMAHLLARGCRRIGYLGNGRAGRANSERHRGWADALAEAGLPAAVAALGPNGRSPGGVEGTLALLAEAEACWGGPPDAILCYNDTMAMGALSSLRRKGLRTPEDVAVTGFDDIDAAAYTHPALTTWRQPRREMGVEAMRMVLDLLEPNRRSAVPAVKEMTGSLVVRESA